MMNRLQVGIALGSLIACGVMCLYPPYEDRAVVTLPEPMYAPLWQPPLGVNGGESIGILWPVLACQWGIVLLLMVGLLTTFRSGQWWRTAAAPAQRVSLWVGIGLGIAMLTFPPYRSGFVTKYKCLFTPEPYTESYSELLLIPLLLQLAAAALLTLTAMRVFRVGSGVSRNSSRRISSSTAARGGTSYRG